MKNKYLLPIGLIALLVLPMLNSCKTGDMNEDRCSKVACDYYVPLMVLDFVDKQGRDLLNPATPGHFDSLKIMQLNNSVRIFPPGVSQPNINHRKLVLIWSQQVNTIYLKLSDTDQDTITYSYRMTEGCCPGSQLTSFSYNAKVYTDSVSKANFTIVK